MTTALPGQFHIYMEEPNCILCGEKGRRRLFERPSAEGVPFTLVRCTSCGLRYLSPRPTEEEIGRYYQSTYFTQRTDRGYDDYFAPGTRSQIESLFLLNLKDLNFENFERSLSKPRKSLDIGCAAGYFVNMLASRGWDARGIDISESCTAFARDRLGLHVESGGYLERQYEDRFDLITLWATIEHLHRPDLFLEKARQDLAEGGRLYLSTCRAGGPFMRIRGPKWRYYNFPEHLYFFTIKQMKLLLEAKGFKAEAISVYGSGFGAPGSAVRKAADYSAKHFGLGDMMVISARGI